MIVRAILFKYDPKRRRLAVWWLVKPEAATQKYKSTYPNFLAYLSVAIFQDIQMLGRCPIKRRHRLDKIIVVALEVTRKHNLYKNLFLALPKLLSGFCFFGMCSPVEHYVSLNNIEDVPRNRNIPGIMV